MLSTAMGELSPSDQRRLTEGIGVLRALAATLSEREAGVE
jgi:hypothetical protein